MAWVTASKNIPSELVKSNHRNKRQKALNFICMLMNWGGKRKHQFTCCVKSTFQRVPNGLERLQAIFRVASYQKDIDISFNAESAVGIDEKTVCIKLDWVVGSKNNLNESIIGLTTWGLNSYKLRHRLSLKLWIITIRYNTRMMERLYTLHQENSVLFLSLLGLIITFIMIRIAHYNQTPRKSAASRKEQN